MQTLASFLAEAEQILLEGRIDFLKQHYQGISTQHDPEARHHDASSIVDHFATHADPTPNKKHTQWVLDQYKKGQIKQSDSESIHSTLTDFEKHNKKLDKKALNQYKNIDEVKDAVDPHVEKESADFRQAKFYGNVHHKTENMITVEPHDVGGACELGSKTKWCTARYNEFDYDSALARAHHYFPDDDQEEQRQAHVDGEDEQHDPYEDNMYHNYEDNLHVHILKNGRKFQSYQSEYGGNHDQLMDETNNPIGKEDRKKYGGELAEHLIKVGKLKLALEHNLPVKHDTLINHLTDENVTLTNKKNSVSNVSNADLAHSIITHPDIHDEVKRATLEDSPVGIHGKTFTHILDQHEKYPENREKRDHVQLGVVSIKPEDYSKTEHGDRIFRDGVDLDLKDSVVSNSLPLSKKHVDDFIDHAHRENEHHLIGHRLIAKEGFDEEHAAKVLDATDHSDPRSIHKVLSMVQEGKVPDSHKNFVAEKLKPVLYSNKNARNFFRTVKLKPEEFDHHIEHGDTDVHDSLYDNPHVSEDQKKKIEEKEIGNPDARLTKNLAQFSEDPKLLEKLHTLHGPAIQLHLSMNDHTPEHVIDKIAENPDPFNNGLMAARHHKSFSNDKIVDVYNRLHKGRDTSLALIHPLTHEKVLHALSDEYPVQTALHPKVGGTLSHKLAKAPLNRENVRFILNKFHEENDIHPANLSALVHHPDLNSKGHADETYEKMSILRRAAAHENTPSDALRHIYHSFGKTHESGVAMENAANQLHSRGETY